MTIFVRITIDPPDDPPADGALTAFPPVDGALVALPPPGVAAHAPTKSVHAKPSTIALRNDPSLTLQARTARQPFRVTTQ
jgi:hypothetical protein